MEENLAEKIGMKIFLFFGIVDVAVGIFLLSQSLTIPVENTLLYSITVVIVLIGMTYTQRASISGLVKVLGIIFLSGIGLYALIKLLATPDMMRMIGMVILGKGGTTLIHYLKIEHSFGE